MALPLPQRRVAIVTALAHTVPVIRFKCCSAFSRGVHAAALADNIMHMQRAAETLKVSIGVMKVHMRTLGILKWSNRKRGAIRRLLRHSPDLQGRSGNTVSYLSWPKPALHAG